MELSTIPCIQAEVSGLTYLVLTLLWCLFRFLCSVPESKVNIIKVIRSILRENVRRNMKSEGTLERGCKERLAPLRSTRPSSAKLGDCSKHCLQKKKEKQYCSDD